MAEIISLHIGKGGCLIGLEQWKHILEEQSIQYDGTIAIPIHTPKISTYFYETAKSKYMPRAVFTDAGLPIIDIIQQSPINNIIGSQNIVEEENEYIGIDYVNSDHLQAYINSVRIEADKCELLQGFQITNYLGDPMSSAFMESVIYELRMYFPKAMIEIFSVIPSVKLSENLFESYNALAALTYLIDTPYMVHLFEYEKLYQMCIEMLQIPYPTYIELNDIIANAITEITSPYRFPTYVNSDLRRAAVNLIPFPRFHFLEVGSFPLLQSNEINKFGMIGMPMLIDNLLNSGNTFCSTKEAKGKRLAVSIGHCKRRVLLK